MSPSKQQAEHDTFRVPVAGDVLHFLVTGMTHPRERGSQVFHEVSKRGQELDLTGRVIEHTRDRLGRSWLDLLHDPAGQVAKFGREVIAPGPAPDGMLPEVGSVEHEDMSQAAYAAAAAIKEPDLRRTAVADAERRFGPRIPTSRTVAHYPGGAE